MYTYIENAPSKYTYSYPGISKNVSKYVRKADIYTVDEGN